MQGVMVVPARGRFAMGQGPKDVDRVYSQREFAEEKYTREEATRFYQWTLLMRSVQQKARFFSFFVKDVIANPAILGVIRDTPHYSDFVTGADGIVKFVTNLHGSANILKNVENAFTALEVNVLPKLGLSAEGHVALYNERTRQLDRIRTGPLFTPAGLETFRFGDLTRSTLLDDLRALDILGRDLVGPKGSFLGILPLLAQFIIGAAVVVIGSVIISNYAITPVITAKEDAIKRAIETLEKSPTVLKLLESIGPQAVESFMGRVAGAGSIMGEVVDILKWIAIATGVVITGGTVVYFLTK